MKKILCAIVSIPVILGAVLLFANHDDGPAGEGSYREAKEIAAAFSLIDPNQPESKLPDRFYRFNHDNGFFYIATGTDSHRPGGDGTIGALFPDGSSYIYFAHLCGPAPVPLGFPGDSKEKVLAGLRADSGESKP